jgi:rhamnogalacturonyl hydrolase YesR
MQALYSEQYSFVNFMKSPLATVRRIGDKLIRDTPFEYRLEVKAVVQSLDRMHCVDFGRTFGLGRPAVAYAWTKLQSPGERVFTLEVEHNDGCQIWLNGVLVYHANGDRDIQLRFDERSIGMSHEVKLALRSGANSLLVKSETRGKEWSFYMQPPATNGAVVAEEATPVEIGLRGVANIADQVAELSNWLVMGAFPNPLNGMHRAGLEVVHAPEREFVFGRMCEGLDGPVTWTLPKVELLGGMIDPLPWGTNYSWNYHNGGVAWGMQELAALSGDSRYSDYASRFCEFHLEGVPFVEYQVKTLNAVDSANHFIIDTPLLDFTLAPSLPLINRLRVEKEFPGRARYVRWVDRMIRYARNEQVRLPGHGIFTRTTPEKFTTWVDDMFMGIPFLIQASLYGESPGEIADFMNDAAHQVLEFNSQVWDEDAALYMHARYFGKSAKLPHWSRCNGWASWAMSEVLQHLSPSHPNHGLILAHFQKHCASLLSFQHESGLWPNVLDRPDSALEVSGSAIFVMAMARGVMRGWLDEMIYRPALIRGWAGLESQIDADGTVHGICMGTMCTEDVNYYIKRPFYDNDTHGLFAVLFAGIEMERLLMSKSYSESSAGESMDRRVPASA